VEAAKEAVSLPSDFTESAEEAAENAVFVVEGVLGGFLKMAVPVVLLGFAVGLSIRLFRVPVERLGGL
jgi:hypothetical protein